MAPDKPPVRTCRCCNRQVTAEQDAETEKLQCALNLADEQMRAANHALSEAMRTYSAARKAAKQALRAKVAHSEAVHGPLKW